MLSVQRSGNATSIINVHADLDRVTSPALEAAILLAAPESERVVISLEHRSYCDSSALALFVRARRSLGSRFMLVIPDGGSIQKIFQITGCQPSYRFTPRLKPLSPWQTSRNC